MTSSYINSDVRLNVNLFHGFTISNHLFYLTFIWVLGVEGTHGTTTRAACCVPRWWLGGILSMGRAIR